MGEGKGFILVAVIPLKPFRLPAGFWRGYIKHLVWVLWTNINPSFLIFYNSGYAILFFHALLIIVIINLASNSYKLDKVINFAFVA